MLALDASGNFTSSFDTSAFGTGSSTYPLRFVYAGDTNFSNSVFEESVATIGQPFATWDTNMDRSVNVLDMISISQHVGETGSAGWIRQDINGDGKVDVAGSDHHRPTLERLGEQSESWFHDS